MIIVPIIVAIIQTRLAKEKQEGVEKELIARMEEMEKRLAQERANIQAREDKARAEAETRDARERYVRDSIAKALANEWEDLEDMERELKDKESEIEQRARFREEEKAYRKPKQDLTEEESIKVTISAGGVPRGISSGLYNLSIGGSFVGTFFTSTTTGRGKSVNFKLPKAGKYRYKITALIVDQYLNSVNRDFSGNITVDDDDDLEIEIDLSSGTVELVRG